MREPVEEDGRPTVADGNEPEISLDLRGLKCPLPVLRTRRRLRELPDGSLLAVRCTDPLASLDIPHLVRETGDTLLSVVAAGGETLFRIRKGTPARSAGEDPSSGADVDRVGEPWDSMQ